jgi:hypothetical protein
MERCSPPHRLRTGPLATTYHERAELVNRRKPTTGSLGDDVWSASYRSEEGSATDTEECVSAQSSA